MILLKSLRKWESLQQFIRSITCSKTAGLNCWQVAPLDAAPLMHEQIDCMHCAPPLLKPLHCDDVWQEVPGMWSYIFTDAKIKWSMSENIVAHGTNITASINSINLLRDRIGFMWYCKKFGKNIILERKIGIRQEILSEW